MPRNARSSTVALVEYCDSQSTCVCLDVPCAELYDFVLSAFLLFIEAFFTYSTLCYLPSTRNPARIVVVTVITLGIVTYSKAPLTPVFRPAVPLGCSEARVLWVDNLCAGPTPGGWSRRAAIDRPVVDVPLAGFGGRHTDARGRL